MKSFIRYYLLFAIVLMSSCSFDSSTNISGLGDKETKAVKYVKTHLDGARLVKYEIVEEQLPLSVYSDYFKKYRDEVYKAQLDYKSCQTRGIQQGMEKALNTILNCQTEIVDRIHKMSESADTCKYLIVLADVKERSGNPGNLIVAFNPQTLKMEKWISITTPIQNNAALIINSKSQTLLPYSLTMKQNFDSLANTVTNPVDRFILLSSPK